MASNTRMKIPRESTIRLNRKIKLDWRGLWVISIGLACVLVAVVTSLANVFYVGGIFIAFMVFLGLVLLLPVFDNMQTSLITKLFLKANQDLGENIFTSDAHKVKEVLDDGKRKRRLPKIAKRLGKPEFVPYRPSEQTADGILGIAKDHSYGGTLTARFSAKCHSLLSDNDAVQMSRLEALAHLMDRWAETGNPISRFSWQVQTLVGQVLRPAEIVESVREGAGFKPNPLLDVSLLFRRMEEMGLESPDHRISFMLTVDPKKLSGDQVRRVGSVEEVLAVECLDFFEALQLGRATSPLGITDGYCLGYNEIMLANRLVLDPVFAHPVVERIDTTDESLVFSSQQVAWPGYFNFDDPEYAQVGETIHMGFYIDDMPHQGLSPIQLGEILRLKIPKTVTVIYDMLPISQAEKRAQWASSAATSVSRDAVKDDVRLTRSQIREQENLEAREDELALNLGQDGRVRVYIDVTGRTVAEARANALILRNACLNSRFFLESLVGRQSEGIEVLMPLGRGLASTPLKK